jgi:predicted protein tyrosine phosphatase
MRVLFVCTANKLRSPTAETLFSGGLEVSSAGLDGSAPRVVDASMVEQADLVFVMERRHRDRLKKLFPGCAGKLVVLGTPDERDQPELVALLLEKVTPFLED